MSVKLMYFFVPFDESETLGTFYLSFITMITKNKRYIVHYKTNNIIMCNSLLRSETF